MRLSEAIRLGSLLIPEPQMGELSKCALGMAAIAKGHQIQGDANREYEYFLQTWPWLKDVSIKCPCSPCAARLGVVDEDQCVLEDVQVVWHIFDEHVMHTLPSALSQHWTLEQLIDFIASIEPREAAEVASAQAVATPDKVADTVNR